MITLEVYKEVEEALLPIKNHITDAGIDVFSTEEKLLLPNTTTVINTGICIKPKFEFIVFSVDDDTEDVNVAQTIFNTRMNTYIKENFNIMLSFRGRSGLASKHSVEVIGGVGDQDYRGVYKVVLSLIGKKSYTIKKGEKIAQFIPHIVPKINHIVEVKSFDKEETDRGTKGFGSSGKQ